MYLHCRLVLVYQNAPNLTVISVHPQQGPPNELSITEFWTLLYWALRLYTRAKSGSDMPVSRRQSVLIMRM